MELYIGGVAQGKTEYVKRKYEGRDILTLQAYSAAELDEASDKVVILQHFERCVRSWTESGAAVESCLEELLKKAARAENRGCRVALLSDEVGNGIVPAEAFEREWRDNVGRALIEVAKRAERVERVLCGIGQRIK